MPSLTQWPLCFTLADAFEIAVSKTQNTVKRLFILLPATAQFIQLLPLPLCLALVAAAPVHKGTASLQLFQICFQSQQTFPPCHVHYLLPDCFQMLFHTFSPAERIPSRAALQLCSIYKDRSMICFSLLLQFFRGDLLSFFIQLPCAILQQALLHEVYINRHSRIGRKIAGTRFMTLILVTFSIFRLRATISREPTQVISAITASPSRGDSSPARREIAP